MDYYTGKDYGPGQGMGYTTVMPKDGFQYRYGEDGTRYSVPIEGYKPNNPGFDGEEKSLIQPVAPPTDQEIRDEGLKFMPQQKYLQKPFELPTKKTEEKGITNTDAFTNSGNDGFDVYNPNPNSISNRDYNSYRYQEATDKNFTRPEKSKFQEMLSKGVGFIPGVGMAKKGLDALGNMLPINRRAIFENELAGQDIMVNDIGQIVSDGGNINTAGNIMAGYNASKVDKDTFKKRRLMIEQKMKDPKQKAAKLKALNAAEEKMLGTATDRTNIIYADDEEEKEKKKKVDFLSRFFKKKKTADTTGTDNKTGTTTGTTTDNTGTTDTTQYANPGDNQSVSSSGLSYDQGGGKTGSYDEAALAKGGRAGYFFGGRARLQGGGMSQGNEENQKQSAEMGNTTVSNNNNNGVSDNPPVTVVNNNPLDISTVTKSVGNYDIPVGLEALMADKGKLQAVLNADNVLDKNLGAEFTYDNGPFSIGAYADMDGDKSLNANYTRNNSNYSFDLNDDGGQLKFTRTFANGGLAGLL